MRSALVSAFVAAALFTPVSIAQAGDTFETVIVHDGEKNISGSKWRFFGHLESGNPECVSDRVVKMFKKDDGKWVFVDKDRTAVDGAYATTGRLPGQPPLKFSTKKIDRGGFSCTGDAIKPFSGPPR